jgi:Ca2+-binding EF-hand superfamily protein
VPRPLPSRLARRPSRPSQLSSFRSLDSSQISFLRSLFLSFSDRPRDQTHVHEFVRKQYRDIPGEARGALGQGILELFRAEDRAAEEERRLVADAANNGHTVRRKERPTPRLTWKSFHRVCAALGLHLSERRGQVAIKRYASDTRNPVDESLAAAIEPGMSFDDFMIFYAGLSKPLSIAQEMREVWRLLDEDLDGLVPLATIRTTMIGLEYIQPSNTQANSTYFYETNFKYHYSEAEKQMTKEQLIDSLLKAHFINKNMETDKINFQEFVEFLYA